MSGGPAFCVSCGAPRAPGDRFCRSCGQPLGDGVPEQSAVAARGAPTDVPAPLPTSPISRSPIRTPVSGGSGWPTTSPPGWGRQPGTRATRAGKVLLGGVTVFVALGVIGLLGAYLEGDLDERLAAASAARPTTPRATEPTTPEPTVRQVTLPDALAGGLIELTAEGRNLEELAITLDSLADEPLDVLIPPGLVFDPVSGTTQPMVVLGGALIGLEPRGSSAWTLEVACASMELDQPDDSDAFTISTAPTAADLRALLEVPDFADATFRVQQFAVWTITDNPSRSGYVGLGSFGIGSGPSDDEIALIRALFKQAGIAVSAYRALR